MQQLIDPFERHVTKRKIRRARQAINRSDLNQVKRDAAHRELDRLIQVADRPGSD